VSSSWFQIQVLQLLPHLPYLIGLCFSARGGLQIQETRSSLKDDVAAFRLACIVAKFCQKGAEVIKRKVRIALSGNKLVEQFFCFTQSGGYRIAGETPASTLI
jgi:hypothetical protein